MSSQFKSSTRSQSGCSTVPAVVQVCRMGHSFVRRFRGRYALFGFRRYQEDISFVDTHAAQDFTQGIKLSDVFHMGSRSLNTDIPVAWRPSCELLVLDIGSNDIAQSKTVNKRAMELLAKFIFD